LPSTPPPDPTFDWEQQLVRERLVGLGDDGLRNRDLGERVELDAGDLRELKDMGQ